MVLRKAKMSAIVERAGIDLIYLAVGGAIIRRALLNCSTRFISIDLQLPHSRIL